MDKWMTKKNVLVVSTSYVLFLVAVFVFGGKCYGNDWCYENVNDLLNAVPVIFLPLLPVFIISLITYKMHQEIFRVWIKFAGWWAPLSILAILVTPSSSGGFIPVPLQFALAAFCSGCLLLISLILITYKSYKLRGK